MKVVLISAAFCLFVIVFAVVAGWKIFLGFVAVIGVYALVVRLMRGEKGSGQRFLDDWPFEDGETVIWRDDRADCGLIPVVARALIMRPLRLRMSSVVVTDRRIIVADLTLFTKRRAVMYVLYPGAAPPDDASNSIDGGLFRRGYITYVIQPCVADLHRQGRFAYVGLKPAVSVGPSLGTAEVRIYSDSLDTFRLPGEGATRPAPPP